MGRGKVRVVARISQPKYQCPLCDYIAMGEKQKELHFKYSHGLKYDGREKNIGAHCGYCFRNPQECSCARSGRRRVTNR